jgi:flagellar basal body-associated protein FliL
MAAREEKTGKRPAGEEEGAPAEQAEEEPKPKTPFTALMVPDALVRVSIGVIVLGALTVGVFFLITDVIGPSLGPMLPEKIRGTASDAEVAPAVEPPGENYMVEEVVINPAGTRGKHFLRLGIALETHSGPDLLAELETRKAQLRDLLIQKFSTRTIDELGDPTVREELRLQCVDEINAMVTSGKISNIYFTDYVLQ